MSGNVTMIPFLDSNGNMVAPFTPEAAVYDENGRRLKDKLKGLDLIKIEEAQSEAIDKINEKENKAIGNFSSQRVIPDMLSPEVMDLIEASGGGTINNMPDGEDLTSKDIAGGKSVMQLADRPYNPLAFSGKGYTILRKNVSALSRGGNSNILTQNMISQPNTVYEVRYDFDLNGTEITVPVGCTLKFSGGTVKNGIIRGNDTNITGLEDDSLLVDFSGTFLDFKIKASYLGLHPNGDGTVENTPNQMNVFLRLGNLMSSMRKAEVTFEKGYYGFGYGEKKRQFGSWGSNVWNGWVAIYLKSDAVTKSVKINGNGAYFLNVFQYYIGGWSYKDGVITPTEQSTTGWDYNVKGGGFIFLDTPYINVSFRDFTVDMNETIFKYGGDAPYSTNNIGVYVTNCIYCELDYITLKNSAFENLLIDLADAIYINKCRFEYGRRHNMAFSGFKFCRIVDTTTVGGGAIRKIEGSYYQFESGNDIDFEALSSQITEGERDTALGDVYIENFTSINARQLVLVCTDSVRSISINNSKAIVNERLYTYSAEGNVIPQNSLYGYSSVRARESFVINNLELKGKTAMFGNLYALPPKDNPSGKDWYYDNSNIPIMQLDNIKIYSPDFIDVNELNEGTARDLLAFPYYTEPINFKWEENQWKKVIFKDINQFTSSGAKSFVNNYVCENISITMKDGYTIRFPLESVGNGKIGKMTLNITEGRKISSFFAVGGRYYPIDNLFINDYVQEVITKSELKYTILSGINFKAVTIKKIIGNFYGFYLSNFIEGNTVGYAVFDSEEHVIDNIVQTRQEYNSTVMLGTGGYDFWSIGNPSSRSLENENNNFNNNVFLTDYYYNNNKASKVLGIRKKESGSYKKYYFGSLSGLSQFVYTDINDVSSASPINGDRAYFNKTKKPSWWDGSKWKDADGQPSEVLRQGTFEQKPQATNGISIGFQYFCTDKKTTEGNRNGIMIYYSGGDVWVDSLGRIVE